MLQKIISVLLKVDSESELIVPEDNCPNELQMIWDRSNLKSSSLNQSLGSHNSPVCCITRQRGGSLSERDLAQSVISTAMKNASWHGINVHLVTPNNADGNCIFESIADNISSRPCFGETINGTGDSLRKLWLNKTEDLVWAFTGGLGNSEETFRKEWGLLQTTKSYECIFGDFVLPAVAHYVQKDILVFNTIEVEHFKQQPIYVVEASKLANRQPTSNIPLVVAYNGYHYESLIPVTDVDVRKTIVLKDQFLSKNYDSSKFDIEGFLESCKLISDEEDKQQKSYANIVKNGVRKSVSLTSIPAESDICPPKKKIKDMTPQELKEYNRQKQQARREIEKQSNEKKTLRRLNKCLAITAMAQEQKSYKASREGNMDKSSNNVHAKKIKDMSAEEKKSTKK